MNKAVAVMAAVSLGLAGCASSTKDLSASYVSPMQYANYDCDQIGAESARLQANYTATGANIDKAASNDVGITAIGAVLFWPALFFIGGNQQQEAEYSRLKGEHAALQQASITKKCTPAPATIAADSPAPEVGGVEHIKIGSKKSL